MPLSMMATLTPRPVLPPRILSGVADARSASGVSDPVWKVPAPQLQAGPTLPIARGVYRLPAA